MEYSIKPEEHELRQARQVVQSVLEVCGSVFGKEEDVKISFLWTEDDFVKTEMSGSTGLTYSFEKAEIEFNSMVENWKKGVKLTTAHEFGHMLFYEKLGNKQYQDIEFMWQHILMESHAMLAAERITSMESRRKGKMNEKELRNLWPDFKYKLSDSDHSEIFMGAGELSLWTGYEFAYMIGQKLLEKQELEDFPNLKRSDVLDAGDELFG